MTTTRRETFALAAGGAALAVAPALAGDACDLPSLEPTVNEAPFEVVSISVPLISPHDGRYVVAVKKNGQVIAQTVTWPDRAFGVFQTGPIGVKPSDEFSVDYKRLRDD